MLERKLLEELLGITKLWRIEAWIDSTEPGWPKGTLREIRLPASSKNRIVPWSRGGQALRQRIDPFHARETVKVPVIADNGGGMLQGMQGDQGVSG